MGVGGIDGCSSSPLSSPLFYSPLFIFKKPVVDKEGQAVTWISVSFRVAERPRLHFVADAGLGFCLVACVARRCRLGPFVCHQCIPGKILFLS